MESKPRRRRGRREEKKRLACVTEFKRCDWCHWRRTRILRHADDSDAPIWACDSGVPKILEALHADPGEIWLDIIDSGRLCSPSLPIEREKRMWIRIPLRCRTEESFVYPSDGHPCDIAEIAYHNTRLESLVRPTQGWWERPLGEGILHDGRLRYGYCTHCGNQGVNVYSDGGLETFNGSRNWVQLEVLCNSTTKLRGGRASRFCINGPSGEVCMKAALCALWVPLEEVPSMVRLS